MSSGKYKYQPLDVKTREFRLVDVQPSPDEKSWLKCSVRHVFLDPEAMPQYETISYVWGNPSMRATLQLNGNSLSVPRSTAAVLRRMRLPDRSRTLWIDAVCIDQENVVEREQQVAMMGDLFRSSKGNLIYLGEGSKSDRRSRRDFQAVLDDMHEETKDKSLRDIFDNEEATRGLRFKVDYERLSDFFELPWFSRLWVMQEAALAPMNTCHLGPHIFDFLEVVTAARWIRHKGDYIPPFLSDCTGCSKAADLFNFMDKQNGTYKDQEPSFQELLEIATGLKVTEPRDLVYGVLGLKEWEPSIPALLYPDYNKSVIEVYRDAARYALHEDGEDWLECWDSISLQSDQQLESENFISWVPDWTRIWDDDVDPNCPWWLDWLWDSAAGHPQDWSRFPLSKQDDLNVFPVYGFVLGKISKVAAEPQKMVSRAKSWAQWLDDTIPMMELPEDLVKVVLVAEANVNDEKATDDDLRGYHDLRDQLRQHQVPPMLDSREDYSTIKDRKLFSALQYFEALKSACRHRKVFRTGSGHVGIGPKISCEDDVVAILYGANKPVVLRPAQEKYRLLGTCYVHGVMEGEATKRHKEQNLPDTLFNLR